MPTAALKASSGYDQLGLTELLLLLDSVGTPATLQTAAANWKGVAAEFLAQLGDTLRPDPGTLNGLLAGLTNQWKGGGADAFGEHFLQLSNYGVEIAARANLLTESPAAAGFATFHNATTDALAALTYVKEQAKALTPQAALSPSQADEAYYNSLNWLDRIRFNNLRNLAASSGKNGGSAVFDQTAAAVSQYQQAQNQMIAANNEVRRQQALQLVNYLADSYTTIGESLPTAPVGTAPTAGTRKDGGPTFSAGVGTPSFASALVGSVGAAPGFTGSPPTGGPILGAPPPTSSHPGNGLPTGLIPLVPGVPLSSGAVPSLATHLPASGTLNAPTQLAGSAPTPLLNGPLPVGLPAPGLPGAVLPGLPAPMTGSLGGVSGATGAVAAMPLLPGPGLATPAGAGAQLGSLSPRPLPGGGPGGINGSSAAVTGGTAGLGGPTMTAGTAVEPSATAPAGLGQQNAASAAALAQRNGTAMAGSPYMPMMPMGGGGAPGGAGTPQRSWLEEDDEHWRIDTDALPPAVIGSHR